jgi:GNAT superfamily N-acetyltransferase
VTASRRRRAGPWARGFGVSLTRFDGRVSAGLEAALRDGIERGYEGALPPLEGCGDCYAIRSGGRTVGLLAFARDVPVAGAVTFEVVAIDPAERGSAAGARTVMAAERRLAREGVSEFYARVPATNGRGLYFMLRAGYAPVLDAPPAVPAPAFPATWFRRSGSPDLAGR